MKNIINLFVLFIICSAQTCSSQDDPKVTSNEYESCCGTSPVEFNLDATKHVYIPNVFTPNGDGVNDFFIPSISGKDGLEIQKFTIYSAVGDTIIFQQDWIGKDSDPKNYGWNGYRKDGSKYKGVFKYGMGALAVGFQKQITGEACCLQCEPGVAILKNKSGCYYPIQAGKEGTLDKTISSTEKDCL